MRAWYAAHHHDSVLKPLLQESPRVCASSGGKEAETAPHLRRERARYLCPRARREELTIHPSVTRPRMGLPLAPISSMSPRPSRAVALTMSVPSNLHGDRFKFDQIALASSGRKRWYEGMGQGEECGGRTSAPLRSLVCGRRARERATGLRSACACTGERTKTHLREYIRKYKYKSMYIGLTRSVRDSHI